MTTLPEFPIFDGHNDSLMHFYLARRGEGRSFFEQSDGGHLDLPRARKGGFAGGFFAVFVPADPANTASSGAGPAALDLAYAQQMTIAMAATLLQLEIESNGQFQVVHTSDELTTCLDQGTLAAVLHFEGAEAIDPDLDALYVFYEAGLRSLGIVWSRPNAFGHGVPFRFPHSPDTGPGLTEAGKALVRACNRLGVMIDLSHLNEKGFWDVAGISEAPLVATHSAAHTLCPSARNLTDKQLDAIGESGGVVGTNFFVRDLRSDGQSNADTPVTEIVRHIDYIANRIGIDHVAFGSDFDGAKIPQEMGDVSGLPKLIAALRDHGFDDNALRKITHENWLRVLGATWK